MPFFAMAAVLLMSSVPLGVLGRRQEPELPRPDPKKEHIRVNIRSAPIFKFYARKDFTGVPAIEVNERGGFVDGALVCSWPDGRYDRANESNMVLGYVTSPAIGMPTLRPCPTGFPVLTIWGDNGLGGAVQLIAVSSRNGLRIDVTFRGKTFYLDLRSLPGTPVAGKTPSLGRFADRTTSWNVIGSEEATARESARAAARLRRDQTFVRFLRDVQACMTSVGAPQCLVPYLLDPVPTHIEIGVGEYKYEPTAAEFADAVWRGSKDGYRYWDDLRTCLASPTLLASQDDAQFEGREGWTCNVIRTKAGWKLWYFIQNPN